MPIGQSMPSFRQGDVIRIPFPYNDRFTRRRQPAPAVSAGGIGAVERLLSVVMITSAANRPQPGDLPMGDRYADAGLPTPAIIRPCNLATIEARHAEPFGQIKECLMREVTNAIKGYLGFR